MSKQQLTIEHLAPYLPYGLEIYLFERRYTITGVTQETLFTKQGAVLNYENSDSEIKILLRPLSDLKKEDYKEELLTYYEGLGISIKHISYYDSGNDNTEDITIAVTYKLLDDVFTDCLINRSSISESPYHFVKWLHENHFDTDGLIEKGLALNLNDLKDE